MPKITELTVEIGIEQVSCPGVWLCQDGRVSLTVFALGTSYQTCLLPPLFPLMFKDIFFFRKRFQDTCALNNLCCLLKDETLYCELVQWSEECSTGKCTILAQYLGSLNEVLFPPNMCWSDGVDLLMRRCKDYPGILSPKIEITTKVRVDEVWNQVHPTQVGGVKVSCLCATKTEAKDPRQKPVCHTSQYHKYMCQNDSVDRMRSARSRSSGSKSCCSLSQAQPVYEEELGRQGRSQARSGRNRRSADCSPRPRSGRKKCDYNVYSVHSANVANVERTWHDVTATDNHRDSEDFNNPPRFDGGALSNISESSQQSHNCQEPEPPQHSHHGYEQNESSQKILLESRHIKQKKAQKEHAKPSPAMHLKAKVKAPCVCEICRRYHDLFHSKDSEAK